MTSEIIRKIIDDTIARLGKKAVYDDYIATAKRLYPKEMHALAQGFKRQGFIKWLKDGMRQVANVDESDPKAPTIQLDLLPGLPAPAYLNVGSDTEPQLVKFTDACLGDIDTAIEKRKRKIGQINARVEDLQYKREWLLANQRGPTESVAEVCKRLAPPVDPEPPPPTGAGPTPSGPPEHIHP